MSESVYAVHQLVVGLLFAIGVTYHYEKALPQNAEYEMLQSVLESSFLHVAEIRYCLL